MPIRLHRFTRPVQIPCRSFWQVIDSAYLCRTRTDNIKTLYLLFTYCYDISVILSGVCASRMRSTNAVEGSLASMHGRDPIGASPPRPAAPSARKRFLRPSHPPKHRMAGGTIKGWPQFGGSIYRSYSFKIVYRKDRIK